MDLSSPLVRMLVLLLAAFVPSLLYTAWIRNTERYAREPWGRVLMVFGWGATFAVGISIVLELVLVYFYGQTFERSYEMLSENKDSIGLLVTACIIAPFVEEAAKGAGVYKVRKAMLEPEDGLIYGAACGLGFAATENVLYEGSALMTGGIYAFIALAVVRSISSSLLHASASAATGYGISRAQTGYGMSAAPYYLLAVLMHGLFNLLASFSVFNLPLLGLVLAIGFSWLATKKTREKIRELDATGYRRPWR